MACCGRTWPVHVCRHAPHRGLRPRLVWLRVYDTLRARDGSKRVADTSGGTLPGRGLFGLFLDSLALDSSAAPKRP